MSVQIFRDLHRGPALLLLPNAWDAGTARLVESLGAQAVATTSAGVAWSRGYPDGNLLPSKQLINVVREMARVIRVPLTVDVEGGYSNDPLAVAQLVTQLLAVGIAGINVEDGAEPADLLSRKIAAIRASAVQSGMDLFINVRTDVYLRALVPPEAAFDECVRRGARYRAAGADGLFIPGLANSEAISAVAGAIGPMPLNIMALPNLPSVGTLQALGVRRLSAGSAIAQAAMGCAGRLASDFLAGNVNGLFAAAAEYSTLNALFAPVAGSDPRSD
jgi:2-methylisocitrate lyase-like PEP mutase family enzyme